jgi:hypothetical protein
MGSDGAVKGEPLQGDIVVSITLYFDTKRADLDNFNKLLLDALTGIAYDDDSQIAELHLMRAYDNARRINGPAIRHELSQEWKYGRPLGRKVGALRAHKPAAGRLQDVIKSFSPAPQRH